MDKLNKKLIRAREVFLTYVLIMTSHCYDEITLRQNISMRLVAKFYRGHEWVIIVSKSQTT